MPQVIKMASVVGKLNTTLDVYEGLFGHKSDAQLTIRPYPEIGLSIKSSLITQIIIGCAALFSDPEKTCGNENMSLKNLVSKHKHTFEDDTRNLYENIKNLVSEMNLKVFRNKHVGHFDLEACLGYAEIDRDITVDKVRKLLTMAASFINMVIRDAKLMEEGHSLSYSPTIPTSRNTKVFLEALK